MRITLDLPRDLVQRARARAAQDGVLFEKWMIRCIEEGLRHASVRHGRSELPVIRPATGRTLSDLRNADLYRILEDEEVGRGRPGG